MGLLVSYIGWILLIITVAIVFLYKRITKNPDAVTSKFSASKYINADLNTSLNLIKQALENSGFKEIRLNKLENCYFAKTKFSMSSFTELIEVQAIQKEGGTEINFKSICSLPTQIYDWGKNKRNFSKFEKKLEIIMNAEL